MNDVEIAIHSIYNRTIELGSALLLKNEMYDDC